MIQENWEESVQEGVVDFLSQEIPKGVWKHDGRDGNGNAHLKACLIGTSKTIPLIEAKLGLSHWQNIFFCETLLRFPSARVVTSSQVKGLVHAICSRSARPGHFLRSSELTAQASRLLK
jgi:secondary thiamine-phosphate synthase enzyme